MEFIIDTIYWDGYERVIQAHLPNQSKRYCIGYLEFDEYCEQDICPKRSKGDKISGTLKILFVNESNITEQETLLSQPRTNSPFVKAIVTVKKKVDNHIVWGAIKGIDSLLQIEFEGKNNDVKEGQNIQISGELALELDDEM